MDHVLARVIYGANDGLLAIKRFGDGVGVFVSMVLMEDVHSDSGIGRVMIGVNLTISQCNDNR